MPTLQLHHLTDIAEQPAGKAHLGELVRRLVYATLAKRRPNLHFLSGATNNYSGWDGWVQVDIDVHGAVHTHRSIWELSTDRQTEKKIKRDFKKSKKKLLPNGWNKPDVTYVAATLRSLTPDKIKSLEKELRRIDPTWAHIVVLSADNFVQWIEKFPSVESWAADEFRIGNLRFGQSLEHFWDIWSKQTLPNINSGLLGAGRTLDLLRAALRIDASDMASIQSDSAEESVGLIYCAAESLPEVDAKLIFSNALVVAEHAHATQLVRQPIWPDSMPIAVLIPPATTLSQPLVQAGYRVINALARKEESSSTIYLERSDVRAFAKALTESMGVAVDIAEAEARAVGCSVTVWHIRKLHSRALQPTLPPWADASKADVVVPAVFLGGWNDVSGPDKAAILSLSGLDSGEFTKQLQDFTSISTPLLEFIGTERLVVAPTAAFEFVTRHISRVHIERLEKTCKGVFSRIAPDVTSRWEGEPPEVRVRDQRTEHSDLLLDGLAEALLRIAVLGATLSSRGVFEANSINQGFVDHLIRDLPGLSNDARVMASLDRQLPYLIEAAPAPFMNALETLIQGDPSALKTWLSDERGIFGRSFHTGLLWGLEGLAWSAEFLPRVSVLLANMSQIDPGGEISNRPFNSLCSIFLAWHPGTSAPLAVRTNALREVLERTPIVGWNVLVQQLPGERRTAHTNHRPHWRHLEQAGPPRPTRREVWESYDAYVGLALEFAPIDVIRYVDLIKAYPNLAPSSKTAIETLLRSLPLAGLDDSTIELIWSALHRLIARHRGFADTDWALPEEVLTRLETISSRFIVNDPVVRYRWLFDDQFPETGHREADFEGRERQLKSLRSDALAAITAHSGWDGIHRLINICRYPHIVGYLATELDPSNPPILRAMDAWQRGGTRSEILALQSASAAKASSNFTEWTESLIAFARELNWPLDTIASAVLDFPDRLETFRLVSGLGQEIERLYWTRRYAFIRTPAADLGSFTAAVMAFVSHGRAHDVIDQDWHQLSRIGYAKVLEVVDAFVVELANPSATFQSGTISHDIQHVFKWLRTQPDAIPSEIARREYALLPLLTSRWGETSSLALHELLKEDPAFFVDVLSDLYKGASETRSLEGEELERARARAHAAMELLDSWDAPPGVDGSNVDESKLTSWVTTARKLLAERDRKEVGDQQIGKLLFHTPPDPHDHAWPHHVIRDLLQRIKSEEIERGMAIESFNSRGVTTRAMNEGGAQERALEQKWRKDAERIAPKWSRAKALCTQIANDWKREADREDLGARSGRARQSR